MAYQPQFPLLSFPFYPFTELYNILNRERKVNLLENFKFLLRSIIMMNNRRKVCKDNIVQLFY